MVVLNCEGCSKLFGSEQYLQLHRKRTGCKAGKPTNLECSLCCKVLPNKIALDRHYSGHISVDKPNTRTKASLTVSNRVSIRRKRVNQKIPNDVQENKRTNRRKAIETRQKSEHIRDRIGNIEDGPSKKKTNKVKEITRRISEVAQGRSLTSGESGQTFAKECNLQSHKKVHANKKLVDSSIVANGPLACTHCKKTFKEQHYLTAHNNRFHSKKSTCDKKVTAEQGVAAADGRDDPQAAGDSAKLEVNKSTENNKTSNKEVVRTEQHILDRPYACDICRSSFKLKFALEDHMRIHLDEKGYGCIACGEAFNRQKELTLHRKISHPEMMPYACRVCRKEFNDHGVLRRHLRIHTQEKSYKCTICGKGFADVTGLKAHKYTHTDERPFQCSICDAKFKQSNSMRIHVQRIHEKKVWYDCDVCDSRFVYKTSLIEHLKRHAKLNSHFCGECEQGFPSSSELFKHRLKHLGKPFACEICSRQFARNYDLKVHKRIHTGERPYSCKVCDMTFSTKHNVVRHELLHTIKNSMDKGKSSGDPTTGNQQQPNDDSQKLDVNKKENVQSEDSGQPSGDPGTGPSNFPFSCSDCRRHFVLEHNYVKHVNAYHMTGAVPCDVCGEVCQGSEELREHIKVMHYVVCNYCKTKLSDQQALDSHIAEKHPDRNVELACDICGEKFTQPTRLYMHRVKHPEAKVHECEKCGTTFARIASLHKHMLSHADVTPHVCSFCDLKFYLQESLDKHVAVKHHMVRPHKCPLCPRQFKTQDLVSRHQKVHVGVANKPFKCDICLVGFGGKVFLQRHMKRFHSGDPNLPPANDLPSALREESGLDDAAAPEEVEECGVTLEIPDEELIDPDHIQMVAEYTAIGDQGDGTVTYIMLEEGHEMHPAVGQEIFLETVVTDHESVSDTIQGISQCSQELQLKTDNAVTEDVKETDAAVKYDLSQDVEVPELASQVQKDHSYLSPGTQIIYISPTDVVMDEEADIILCDPVRRVGDGSISEDGTYQDEDAAMEHLGETDTESNNGQSPVGNDLSAPLSNDGGFQSTLFKKEGGAEDVQEEVSDEPQDKKFQKRRKSQYITVIERHSSGAIARKRIPNQRKLHECRVCGNSYLSRRQLTCHFKSNHPDEALWFCLICQRDYKNYSNYREHMFGHSKETEFVCHICGKPVYSKERLRKHIQSHEELRPYRCEQCGKNFKAKFSLLRHKFVHDGEKTLECELCQKRFYFQDQLNEHLKRHYGIKPYHCDRCDKSYTTSSNLRTHQKSHAPGGRKRGRPPTKKRKTPEMVPEEDSETTDPCPSNAVAQEVVNNVVTLDNVQLVVGEHVISDGQFATVTLKPIYSTE